MKFELVDGIRKQVKNRRIGNMKREADVHFRIRLKPDAAKNCAQKARPLISAWVFRNRGAKNGLKSGRELLISFPLSTSGRSSDLRAVELE